MRKRNKIPPRFAVTRRGYDIPSVEAYIESEREKADKAGLEQKERIRALQARCDALSEELDVYRGKEEQIKSALMAAGEQAEKKELDIKLRYATELERLKLFRAKWTNAYEELKERYSFGKDALNMESVAVSVKLELENSSPAVFRWTRRARRTKLNSRSKRRRRVFRRRTRARCGS